MRRLITLVWLANGMLLSALSAAPQADPPPQPTAILDNGEMMDIFFKPAYGDFQQAMAVPSADRKPWATIYQKAVRLAEIENLLLFRSHEDTRRPEWAATAARARQTAADVAAAALVDLRTVKPENYEVVRAKYPAVAETCNACHRTFAREAPAIKP